MDTKQVIEGGKAILGIELGSTRIKAVLIDEDNKPIVQGSHTWENQLVDGLWTYSTEAIWNGLQDCYADLRKEVKTRFGIEIENLAAIGISAMMHGYLPFNKQGDLLAPFRTWRNTNTGEAAKVLSQLFVYNIPLRWSISHIYQAILDKEDHIKDIDFLTTLAGYIHWQLTGKKVLGIGDASGMIPVNPDTKNYREDMVDKFDELIAPKNLGWKLRDILPEVLVSGAEAGVLTEDGALRLDPSGHLKKGIPFCPPEGDAANSYQHGIAPMLVSPFVGKGYPFTNLPSDKESPENDSEPSGGLGLLTGFLLFLSKHLHGLIVKILILQRAPVRYQQTMRIVLCTRHILDATDSHDGAFNITRSSLDNLRTIVLELTLMLIQVNGVTDDGTDCR